MNSATPYTFTLLTGGATSRRPEMEAPANCGGDIEPKALGPGSALRAARDDGLGARRRRRGRRVPPVSPP
jgi:hypothetical protein